MFSRGIILNRSCCHQNSKLLNSFKKNLSYRKIHPSVIKPSNNDCNKNKMLLRFDKSLPKISNARMIYLSQYNETLNKWYTTNEINSQQTEKEMYDMICEMTTEQRNLFSKALALWESQEVKGQFEGKLAATRWRSHFGRPAKLPPTLGTVDPSGSYCAVPEDWLQKKFVETTPPPEARDLVKLCVSNALPFVGFGFLDNFTMIIAGDYIEHTLGLFMCISTMAAAALGNTISDVLGIGSAYYIERMAEAVGVKPPKLTPIQLEMPSSRRYANFGRVIGITVGCILGMCPLLFMKDLDGKKDKDKDKDAAPLVQVAADV